MLHWFQWYSCHFFAPFRAYPWPRTDAFAARLSHRQNFRRSSDNKLPGSVYIQHFSSFSLASAPEGALVRYSAYADASGQVQAVNLSLRTPKSLRSGSAGFRCRALTFAGHSLRSTPKSVLSLFCFPKWSQLYYLAFDEDIRRHLDLMLPLLDIIQFRFRCLDHSEEWKSSLSWFRRRHCSGQFGDCSALNITERG